MDESDRRLLNFHHYFGFAIATDKKNVETSIKVPPALYLCILRQAIEKGMSVVELLEQVFYKKGANLHSNFEEENLESLTIRYK